MLSQSYLRFTHNQTRFAIEAVYLQEIVEMPLLSRLVEMPQDFIGCLNLRGRPVPIVDLYRREDWPLHPDEKLLILKAGELMIGLRVHSVEDFLDLPSAQLLPLPDYGEALPLRSGILKGLLKIGAELVTLLDAQSLVRLPGAIFKEPGELAEAGGLTPDQVSAMRERARRLSAPEPGPPAQHSAFTVFRLEGGFFALEASQVHEFTVRSEVTPVFGGPAHLAGLMYFRGQLLTLIDLRSLLSLDAESETLPARVLILEPAEFGAALLVDEICAISYLDHQSIQTFQGPQGLVRATTLYQETFLSLLDIQQLVRPK